MSDETRIVPGERTPSVLVLVGGHPCAITAYGAYGSVPLPPALLLRLRDQYGPGAAFTAMDTDYALFAALLTIAPHELPDVYDEAARRDTIIAAIRGAAELHALLRRCGGFEAAAKYITEHAKKD